MFGYSEPDLMGSNISILMPEPQSSAHDGYIKRFLETGENRMIGTDRTVTARRKDGTECKCRLGLSKLNNIGAAASNGSGDNNGNKKGVMFVGLLLLLIRRY